MQYKGYDKVHKIFIIFTSKNLILACFLVAQRAAAKYLRHIHEENTFNNIYRNDRDIGQLR